MSYAAETPSILSTFATAWGSRTEIRYENEIVDPEPSSDWVHVMITPEPGIRVSIGESPRFRYPGMVIVEIRVEAGIGSVQALEHADEVIRIFREASVSGIHFRTGYVEKMGVVDGRFTVAAFIPFDRDTIF